MHSKLINAKDIYCNITKQNNKKRKRKRKSISDENIWYLIIMSPELGGYYM